MKIDLKNIDFLDAKSLKQITDLYYINVKIEKERNKPIVNKLFKEESIYFSLCATIWEKHNHIYYEKITSKLILNYSELKNISFNEIKSNLLTDIYRQVIKNKIMML